MPRKALFLFLHLALLGWFIFLLSQSNALGPHEVFWHFLGAGLAGSGLIVMTAKWG